MARTVRPGVQSGVGEPAPARGGAVVGGKGRLIFLYSDNSDALTTREVGRAEAFDEQ
jgi:hypothetical protein